MFRKFLLIFLLLLSYITYSQTKKDLPLISISKCCKLGFTRYNKEFNMHQEPFILKGGKKYKIQGYDKANYSGGQILSVSPNKTLYENYLCVIIDVLNRKVVMELQTDCGGKWNNKNRWINDGKVIF